MKKQVMYIGRIASVPGSEGFSFININSVEKQDGSPHELETKADIFLHREEFCGELQVGSTILFEVIPDTKRGVGYYRATAAVAFVEVDLLLADQPPMEGFNGMVPFGESTAASSLIVAPTPAQKYRMKAINPADIEKALENKPAATIPRDSSIPENITELLQAFLMRLFPSMAQFGSHFRLDADETELLGQLEEARGDHAALGMNEQLVVLEDEVNRFLTFRKALTFMLDEKLIRRDTIIPMEYLPDFFMAVPVWFFWAEEGSQDWMSIVADPHVHPSTSYFCDLFPSQNWSNMFQLFNRRARNLSHYKGDVIPPHVSRRIRKAVQLFDYVVIMTPYHDVAGQDWQDSSWLRSIDPYVVGFKKGVPFFFILARFSDSGTFPLFTEMVADTTAYLRANVGNLKGFNAVANPYWYLASGMGQSYQSLRDESKPAGLGDYLTGVVHQALEAFDAGQLFDWMRGKPIQ